MHGDLEGGGGLDPQQQMIGDLLSGRRGETLTPLASVWPRCVALRLLFMLRASRCTFILGVLLLMSRAVTMRGNVPIINITPPPGVGDNTGVNPVICKCDCSHGNLGDI